MKVHDHLVYVFSTFPDVGHQATNEALHEVCNSCNIHVQDLNSVISENVGLYIKH